WKTIRTWRARSACSRARFDKLWKDHTKTCGRKTLHGARAAKLRKSVAFSIGFPHQNPQFRRRLNYTALKPLRCGVALFRAHQLLPLLRRNTPFRGRDHGADRRQERSSERAATLPGRGREALDHSHSVERAAQSG